MWESAKKISAFIIIEVLGRPPEHLKETLKKISEDISKEKGIKITRQDVKEPTLIANQKDLYSSFIEIDIDAENIMSLLLVLFKYMPAHIEIISPEEITLTNNNLNEMLNEITRRLHGYEEIVRLLQIEKTKIEKK